MAISSHCSSRPPETQVISSKALPAALDFVLPALWSWSRAHPDCSYRAFREAYLRARLLAERSAK